MKLLLILIVIGSASCNEEMPVYQGKPRTDGYMDFRGMGIFQIDPYQFPLKMREFERACCSGYTSYRRDIFQEETLSYPLGNIPKADFSHNVITSIEDNQWRLWRTLTHLRIDYNGMSEISKKGFGNLCLQVLSLKGNKLTSVRFELACKADLVDLSHNYIRELQGFKLWPLHLDYSWNLIESVNSENRIYSENLYLTGNKIKEFFHLSFTWIRSNLFLEENLIERLEGNISNMRLNELSLSRNRISTIDDRFFKDSHTLLSINLSRNNISEIPNALFSNLNDLRVLDLSWNKITQLNVASFGRLIGLQKFSIIGNPILKIPLNFLKQSKILKQLDLSGQAETAYYINQFPLIEEVKWSQTHNTSLRDMASFVPKLSTLELNHLFIRDLIEILDKCNISALRCLSLDNVRLFNMPNKMMNTSLVLRDLTIIHNYLERIDMIVLPETLEKLNLSNNRISLLNTTLGYNLPSLRILDLQYNMLRTVPQFLSQRKMNCDFINLKDNPVIDVQRVIETFKIRTKFICFEDKCSYLALIDNTSEPGVLNPLKCQCHSSIRNLDCFASRKINVRPQFLRDDLFRNNVVGCIKHASIYGMSNIELPILISSISSKLLSLYMHEGNISTIDSLLLKCSPQLRKLTITKCGLANIDKNVFSAFPQLVHLDLSHNSMTAFNLVILDYCPKMEVLNLSFNKLMRIPTPLVFSNIVQFKECDLSHNMLEEMDFRQMYYFSKLTKLDLSYNNIRRLYMDCDPYDIHHICHKFPLKNLSLAHNRLTEWTQTMGHALQNIVELNLRNNCILQFEHNGCVEINLQLSGNQIHKLSHVISKCSPNVLNLSANLIEEINRDDISDKPDLKELYLSRNRIHLLRDGCFGRMLSIEVLDLSYNQLRTLEAEKIFAREINLGFWRRYALKKLHLQGNQELQLVSLTIEEGSANKMKLTLSNLCRIMSHHCRLSGSEMQRILQISDKDDKRNILALEMEVDSFVCSEESPITLDITCIPA